MLPVFGDDELGFYLNRSDLSYFVEDVVSTY